MIQCPNCKEYLISDNVNKCYHCGYPITEEELSKAKQECAMREEANDTKVRQEFSGLFFRARVVLFTECLVYIGGLFLAAYFETFGVMIIFSSLFTVILVTAIVYEIKGAFKCPFCKHHFFRNFWGAYCPRCGKKIRI